MFNECHSPDSIFELQDNPPHSLFGFLTQLGLHKIHLAKFDKDWQKASTVKPSGWPAGVLGIFLSKGF